MIKGVILDALVMALQSNGNTACSRALLPSDKRDLLAHVRTACADMIKRRRLRGGSQGPGASRTEVVGCRIGVEAFL